MSQTGPGRAHRKGITLIELMELFSDEDSGGQHPRRYRSRDLRIDATPEEVAAAIGVGLPKAPHEWNYLSKPMQSDTEAHPQRRSKSGLARVG